MRKLIDITVTAAVMLGAAMTFTAPSMAMPYCQPGQCDDWWRDPPPPPPPATPPPAPDPGSIRPPKPGDSVGNRDDWVEDFVLHQNGNNECLVTQHLRTVRWTITWHWEPQANKWMMDLGPEVATDQYLVVRLAWVSCAPGSPVRENPRASNAQYPAQQDRFRPGEQLIPGQGIRSVNGRYALGLKLDGNVVLSNFGSGTAIWQSNTSGKMARLIFQGDGNLVLYSANNQAVWHTVTYGKRANEAVLQDDGNFVVYAPGVALWHTHTWGGVYHP